MRLTWLFWILLRLWIILSLGGVLDLYFLSGPSPVEVAQQYSDIVGKPAMIPFWALGFQQCRYGYNGLSMSLGFLNPDI